MKLYLVQHGQCNPEEVDPEKNLSENGAAELKKICECLLGAGIKPQKIWHSGKARAAQTAKIIAGILQLAAEVTVQSGLQPNDDAAQTAKIIEAETADLMLAGHMPHLNKLASLLLGKDQSLNLINFQPGAILCLEKRTDNWQVNWMVEPGMKGPF